MKYDIENWKSFRVGDIFEIKASKPIKRELTDNAEPGKILVVHGGFTNYGTEKEKTSYSKDINKGNCLSFARTSEHVFYRTNSFITRDSVALLYHKKLNRYIGIFIGSLLEMNKFYEFGRKRLMKNVKEEIIKLPVTPKGEIDWNFMEEQGKLAEYQVLKESKIIQKLIAEGKLK